MLERDRRCVAGADARDLATGERPRRTRRAIRGFFALAGRDRARARGSTPPPFERVAATALSAVAWSGGPLISVVYRCDFDAAHQLNVPYDSPCNRRHG